MEELPIQRTETPQQTVGFQFFVTVCHSQFVATLHVADR